MKNIFVLGLEPFNLSLMEQMPGPGDFRLHELLRYDEAARPVSGCIAFEALLAELFPGAEDPPELPEKYAVARELLPFDIEVTEPEPA